jgi:predicted nucleic acid-binding protein
LANPNFAEVGCGRENLIPTTATPRVGTCAQEVDRYSISEFRINELPMLKILAFGPEELTAAAGLVKRFADQKITLTDANGLAIMRERHIVTCWSTDRHLSLTGVALVI